ncbi:hypothetical protein [Chryseobacterium herbae]|nr:hypothetical protein [Chryseobacterium sp. pc1-10]
MTKCSLFILSKEGQLLQINTISKKSPYSTTPFTQQASIPGPEE